MHDTRNTQTTATCIVGLISHGRKPWTISLSTFTKDEGNEVADRPEASVQVGVCASEVWKWEDAAHDPRVRDRGSSNVSIGGGGVGLGKGGLG